MAAYVCLVWVGAGVICKVSVLALVCEPSEVVIVIGKEQNKKQSHQPASHTEKRTTAPPGVRWHVAPVQRWPTATRMPALPLRVSVT
jgi:hypothetical protein